MMNKKDHMVKERKKQPKVIVSIKSILRKLKILRGGRKHSRIQVIEMNMNQILRNNLYKYWSPALGLDSVHQGGELVTPRHQEFKKI